MQRMAAENESGDAPFGRHRDLGAHDLANCDRKEPPSSIAMTERPSSLDPLCCIDIPPPMTVPVGNAPAHSLTLSPAATTQSTFSSIQPPQHGVVGRRGTRSLHRKHGHVRSPDHLSNLNLHEMRIFDDIVVDQGLPPPVVPQNARFWRDRNVMTASNMTSNMASNVASNVRPTVNQLPLPFPLDVDRGGNDLISSALNQNATVKGNANGNVFAAQNATLFGQRKHIQL